jgi:hypothetical protein
MLLHFRQNRLLSIDRIRRLKSLASLGLELLMIFGGPFDYDNHEAPAMDPILESATHHATVGDRECTHALAPFARIAVCLMASNRATKFASAATTSQCEIDHPSVRTATRARLATTGTPRAIAPTAPAHAAAAPGHAGERI